MEIINKQSYAFWAAAPTGDEVLWNGEKFRLYVHTSPPWSPGRPSGLSGRPSGPSDRPLDPSNWPSELFDGRQKDKQKYVLAYGISPHSTGLRPLSGPLPKKVSGSCGLESRNVGELPCEGVAVGGSCIVGK